jgi:coiled-coil domain-containing protein 40
MNNNISYTYIFICTYQLYFLFEQTQHNTTQHSYTITSSPVTHSIHRTNTIELNCNMSGHSPEQQDNVPVFDDNEYQDHNQEQEQEQHQQDIVYSDASDDDDHDSVLDDDDEEEVDDDDDETEFVDANDPAMERVQRALYQSLKREDDRLTLKHREMTEQLARAKKEREHLGVELYGFQQQLAKSQTILDNTHANFFDLRDKREQIQHALDEAAVALEQQQQQKRDIEAKRESAQDELNRLNEALIHVEKHNEQLRGEIEVTRQATYGTEDHMQSLEKEKRSQDIRIDRLQEQIRQAREQLAMYDDQLEAQKGASTGAAETLHEAESDMAQIVAEKNSYVKKWQSTLLALRKRDEALEAAENMIFKHRENVRQMSIEILGYKKAIKTEHQENEKLTAVLMHLEHEAGFVEKQIEAINQTRQQLTDQYRMLRMSLDENDQVLSGVSIEKKRLELDIESMRNRFEKVAASKQKIEDRIMESLNDQTTLENGATNVYKQTQKLREKIREKEIDIGEVRNELARIEVDILNTEAHNRELDATHKEFEKELEEQDSLIEKYENEIRQRHDEVEKKQIYMVRLNRKYEALTAHKEEANLGPLEATIKNLSKEILQHTKQNAHMQKEWIRRQTEMVKLVSETNQLQDNHKELTSRQVLLEQKRLRVEQQLTEAQHETSTLKKKMHGMHFKTSRLNDLINKNNQLREELQRTNFNKQTEFVEKLKQLEEESQKRDVALQKLKDDKEKLFDEIVEVERQIMLWEKKIQLEKETQAALDPEYGQPEIRGMRKEIHRMELRYSQLLREQERLVQEMERAITKREFVKLSRAVSKSKGEHLTKATLKKRITNIKAVLNQTMREVKQLDQEISNHEKHDQDVLSQLENTQAHLAEMQARRHFLMQEKNRAALEKRVALERTMIAQTHNQRLQKAIDSKYNTSAARERLLENIAKQEHKAQQYMQAVEQLAHQFPDQQHILAQLRLLIA